MQIEDGRRGITGSAGGFQAVNVGGSCQRFVEPYKPDRAWRQLFVPLDAVAGALESGVWMPAMKKGEFVPVGVVGNGT